MRHTYDIIFECPADSVEFDSSPRVSPIPGGAGAYRKRPDGNSPLPVKIGSLPAPIAELDHLRVHVGLAELESQTRKTYLELFRKPRTCSKAADQECDLLTIDQVSKKNRIYGRSSREGAP